MILPIANLRGIEEKIEDDFRKRHKRSPELADKVKKVVEEAGEVIHAQREITISQANSDDKLMDEIADWAIAAFSTAYLLGFTDQEIRDGFERTIRKLNRRWNGAIEGPFVRKA